MYRFYILTLFCLTLSFSCTEKNIYADFSPDLLGEATDTLYYSEFVDSLEYIPLETSENCLIGKIADVRMCCGLIFVFDQEMQTVWIFDEQGKYVHKIFKQGNGPGEYVNLRQFEVDEETRQVIILDIWTKRLMFYDFEGNYQKEIPLDIWAMDFKMIPTGGYIVSLEGADDETAGVYQVDESGETVGRLVKRDSRSMRYFETNWELCSFAGRICFMSPIFENDVYCFVDGKLSRSYAFDMQPPLKHYYGKDASFQNMEDFVRTLYVEGERWILATYWSGVHGSRRFLFSKKDRTYRIGRYLKNDFDSISRTEKTSEVSGNRFVFWYIPEEESDENPVLQILHLK